MTLSVSIDECFFLEPVHFALVHGHVNLLAALLWRASRFALWPRNLAFTAAAPALEEREDIAAGDQNR
jgi:hypothetical protein